MLAVLCTATFVALVGLGVGCSKDDIVGTAGAGAVEAGLNDALEKTVVPVVTFLHVVPTIVNGGAGLRSPLGLACPNTAGVCSGGSVVCTLVGGGTQLSFDFDECVVATGGTPFTLDGVMVATPGDPILLQFNSLFLSDTSSPLTGTGSVSVANCNYTVAVSNTDDVSVNGTIIQCNADNYPTNQSFLTITLDTVVLDVSFDGSSIATAEASSSGHVVANCDINLALDPISSSCSAP